MVPETGAMGESILIFRLISFLIFYFGLVDMDTGMETNPIMVEVGADFQADEHMEAEEVVDFRPEAQVVEQERLQVSEALVEDEQKRTKQTILPLYLCDVFVRNYSTLILKNQKLSMTSSFVYFL